MDAFRGEAIRLALRRMFRPDGYFCIVTVKDCAASAGIVIPGAALDELRPLHCVHWSDMTPEMRDEVQRRTLGLFTGPEIEFGDLARPLIGGASEASGIFRRLLGKGVADA